MNNSPTPRRRWFQFRLATIFWVTLAIAAICFWQMERRERQRMEDVLEEFSRMRGNVPINGS
jgi:cytochrome oxidase assembly protein ShyY1